MIRGAGTAGCVLLGSAAFYGLHSHSVLNSKIAHAHDYISTRLVAEKDLIGGDRRKRTLYLVHDSSVPTQVEYIVEMQEKQVYDRLDAMGINLVHLDVRRHDVSGLCDKAKVSRKDKPSFFLRAEDSLHKVTANSVNEDFPEGI